MTTSIFQGGSPPPGSGMDIFDAAGPAARRVAELATWSMVGGILIGLVVLAVLAVALLRERGSGQGPGERPDREPDEARGHLWVFGATGAVLVILVAFYLTSVSIMPSVLLPPADPGLRITVAAEQWWWEIRYHREGGDSVVTANELHIPVGEPVAIRLISDNVIHSFWVPTLQGKTDVVPGRENETWLQADSVGVYRGQCAEFCGIQHAHMAFHVVARERDDFDRWLASQAEPAPAPADSLARRGRELFVSTCSACHTVRGTPARGRTGPDLTHLAGRRWLAAGMLPNTPENLRSFVADAGAVKPGVVMPSASELQLDSADVRAVVTYLETLR